MSEHKVFKSFPIIKIDDIMLRELSLDDVNDFFQYISNSNVNRYLAEEDYPKTIEDSKNELIYWSRLFYYKHSIYWGIANSENKLIGTCGFNNWSMSHQRVEISYDLDYSYWGRGIMTRILRKVCEFAFEQMDANRIQATVAIDNLASIRVLEKLGFNREGLLKQYGILHNVKTDFYMYSLIKSSK